ncbi:MAG: ROK family protein [Firmicutes bacterium]|nr:ROK family protein [Bacillota bacterium]
MFVGIDLGGTNIAGGLVNGNGKLLEKIETPTLSERGSALVIADIVKLCKKLASREQVRAVGIGFPGFVDSRGQVLFAPNLGWQDVLLTPALESQLGLPVRVANDASVAALAEARAGVTSEFASSLFLTLGTGVGGGIVIDGKLWNGSRGAAGEVGHMVVGESLHNCGCGKNGCLEAFASATALVQYAAHLMENRPSVLPANPDARAVFAAARQGDEVASMAVERLIHYLALGIVNLINIFDPDAVAIGGGLARAGEQLFTPLRKAIAGNLLVPDLAMPPILLARMGNDAGIVGAAMLGADTV